MKFLLIIISLSNFLFAEKIELKDGTVIYGDFEGIADDYYIVRTKYGVLSISKNEVINNPDIELSTQNFNNKGYELKMITIKSTETYTRFFYNYDIIVATQVFLNSGVLISSSGFIKDGIYYEYDEKNDMVAERTIKHGIENGPVIEFYPNGIIKSRIDFKDGKLSGKAFFYTEDSRLILEQTYTNGLLDGFSIEYDLDGNIKSKILYSNGKIFNDIVKEEVKDNNKEEKNNEKNIFSEVSIRVVKIARGNKFFIYKNNKYTGSFTLDDDYNVIDISGNIKDGEYDIKDKKINFKITFDKNWPKKLFDINTESSYIYNELGQAKKQWLI